MKNITIREKLILYSVLLGIAAIALTSFNSYKNARQAIIDRTFDQLISLRVVKKNQLEYFFRDRIRDIQLLQNDEELKKTLGRFSTANHEKPDEIDTPDQNLISYFTSCGYYNRLIIFASDGRKRINLLQNSKTLKGSFDSNYYSKLFHYVKGSFNKDNTVKAIDYLADYQGRHFLFIVAPLKFEDNQGFAVLEIYSDIINRLMFENNPQNGFGLTGDFYLAGSDFLMRSNSRFLPNSVMKTKVETKSVIKALNNNEGSEIISDYRNIKCLSSYSRVNVIGLNWVIIAEFDLSEAMIPIDILRKNMIFIGVFISIILFILAYIFSGMISLPIKHLKKASEQVSSGNFDIQLKVTSNDELGALISTFNHMANELKSRSEQLKNEQHRSLRAMVDGQDLERQRLSRELHDGLGQELIAIKLKMESIDPDKDLQTNKVFLEIKRLFDKIIDEIRRISNNLMPAQLDEFGIINAVKNLCNDIQENSSIKIEFKYSELPKNMNNRIKIYLYRIIQEGITNIIKHAEAGNALIQLEKKSNELLLNIKDNGKGFEIALVALEDCRGIYNMRERVKLLNGQINIMSELGLGTEILIKIPLN